MATDDDAADGRISGNYCGYGRGGTLVPFLGERGRQRPSLGAGVPLPSAQRSKSPPPLGAGDPLEGGGGRMWHLERNIFPLKSITAHHFLKNKIMSIFSCGKFRDSRSRYPRGSHRINHYGLYENLQEIDYGRYNQSWRPFRCPHRYRYR